MTTKVPENCLECPSSRRISDPGSSDSFDAMDESLCCALVTNIAQGRTRRGETYPGRIIVACERSSATMRAEAKTPDWCPLRKLTEVPDVTYYKQLLETETPLKKSQSLENKRVRATSDFLKCLPGEMEKLWHKPGDDCTLSLKCNCCACAANSVILSVIDMVRRLDR